MDLTLVDPELLPALEAMPELDIWADLGVTRKMAFERSAFLASQQAQITSVSSVDYQVVQVDDDDVPVRVYRPANVGEQLPALLWIHGGGFCFGSLDADDYSGQTHG
jgi:acetyl esterase/lipase